MSTGDVVFGGQEIKELPGHFNDQRKPRGFDTKSVFLSPTIRYSGLDMYAPTERCTSVRGEVGVMQAFLLTLTLMVVDVDVYNLSLL